MRQLFKGNATLIRQIFSAGFFHFIHAFTSILLLLLVGQIISQSDSTKSRLLQFLLLGKFNADHQWFWVIALLVLKFIGTSLRNYYLQSAPFNIQIALQNFWIEQNVLIKNFYPDKDIRNYAKAYVKGRIIWRADICLLILIFLLLFHLNVWVAFFWVMLWLMGMLFRMWVVHYYLSTKNEWRAARSAIQKKWKFLFLNRHSLKRDQQWKKEFRILKRREEKSEIKFRLFGFQKAWTSGFFPVYFFSFVFLLAWSFQSLGSDRTIILQLTLMVIYSQGAFMRSFKAPEFWRTTRNIERKWGDAVDESNKIITQNPVNQDPLDSVLQTKDLKSLSVEIWKTILPLFYLTESVNNTNYKRIFKKVALLDMNQHLIGDTFLSAVISDKEAVHMPVLNNFFSAFTNKNWNDFPWKSKLDKNKCSQREYVWLHFFKALLHPGEIILFRDDKAQKIDQLDLDIFLTLTKLRNKKIIYIHE